MCKIASNSASIVPDSEIRQEAARRSSHAYRPFFLAGILFMLLAGAGWGLLLVVKFAIARDYTEFSIHQLNAHGRAMISGFVNLFIIGFAYQAFSGLIAHPIATPRTRLGPPPMSNTPGPFTRAAGVLHHPTSLRSTHGIGDHGEGAGAAFKKRGDAGGGAAARGYRRGWDAGTAGVWAGAGRAGAGGGAQRRQCGRGRRCRADR